MLNSSLIQVSLNWLAFYLASTLGIPKIPLCELNERNYACLTRATLLCCRVEVQKRSQIVSSTTQRPSESSPNLNFIPEVSTIAAASAAFIRVVPLLPAQAHISVVDLDHPKLNFLPATQLNHVELEAPPVSTNSVHARSKRGVGGSFWISEYPTRAGMRRQARCTVRQETRRQDRTG
ncbi:hypothetical protein C8R46DRAFT_1206968 [Mycena filopes]|nr:hypothetical protein C8R46DRAFT_1206968 [Mycena filopes]